MEGVRKLNIAIRHEEPKDYRRVEEITREAFWNLYQPGCNEHFIVHSLREHPDYIPELSFIIELDGKIVGSIFYSHSKVVDQNGNIRKTITFGPVSILPALHRKGLGRTLITHSIEEARKLGYSAIIIGGYPYHYNIYGFEGAKKYSISMADGNYYTGIMALPLYEGALDDISGSVYFSEALEVNEDDVRTFDEQFPPKEKMVTESQVQFEKAVIEIDTKIYRKQSGTPGV